MKKYVTHLEVAKAMGLSPDVIRRRGYRDGTMPPCRKVGRTWIYERKAIERWAGMPIPSQLAHTSVWISVLDLMSWLQRPIRDGSSVSRFLYDMGRYAIPGPDACEDEDGSLWYQERELVEWIARFPVETRHSYARS